MMNKHERKIKELESEIHWLRSSLEELKVLNDIAVSSGKAADTDEMLNIIVNKSMKAVDAEQGSILIVNNEEKTFKTIIRQDDTSRLKHNYSIGANITGWVLINKKPLIIKNLADDKRFKLTEEEKRYIRSVLCVPIWFEGTIIGLMMMLNKKSQQFFSEADLTLFTIISVQAGQLIKNLELQKETFQKRKEAEKLGELDKIKTSFFTGISHEFRTPLTLILGPAKQILDEVKEVKVKEKAEIIYRNAARLHNLTNQLLDILKIEAGQMKLRASRCNLILLLKEIVLSFQAFAERKKIILIFKAPADDISIYFDKDKIEKVLNNILSNAFKFTAAGGNITVEVSSEEGKEFVEIIISDSGIGIPESQINKIFEKFYQINSGLSEEYEGSGIGLSLAKELVELHKGKIFVESEEGKGSAFKVILPLGCRHLSPEEIIMEKPQSLKGKERPENNFYSESLDYDASKKLMDVESYTDLSKPLLLVIEDNPDVRKYIKGILSDICRILEASDGDEGLSKSYDEIPDLIISDIMMPKRDGIQLCKSLKSDPRTSHIPLILLTAKAGMNDKIEGLETGADDYIIKPFEAEELRARIKNLLDQRNRIHDHFKKFGLFGIEETNLSSVDKKFLSRALEIINEHLADSFFSVEEFAESLAVSRSLLHKKLNSLTGESPNELIRRIRLNKAARMIETKSGNISEIALEVGFNNPSYFTECFQKQFGFTPSQYHHSLDDPK